MRDARRSAKEHTIGWRKEFNNQLEDILSHSLPMALPAALFVMQQVRECHVLCMPISMLHMTLMCHQLACLGLLCKWTAADLALQVLVIIAASHLDAVTFQIGSQSFKILPTALFAAWLLGQRLSGMQWASLPV